MKITKFLKFSKKITIKTIVFSNSGHSLAPAALGNPTHALPDNGSQNGPTHVKTEITTLLGNNSESTAEITEISENKPVVSAQPNSQVKVELTEN